MLQREAYQLVQQQLQQLQLRRQQLLQQQLRRVDAEFSALFKQLVPGGTARLVSAEYFGIEVWTVRLFEPDDSVFTAAA